MYRASHLLFIYPKIYPGNFYFTAKPSFLVVKNSYVLHFWAEPLIPTILKLMTWFCTVPHIYISYNVLHTLQWIMAIFTLPPIWGLPNRCFRRLRIFFVFAHSNNFKLKFCTEPHIYIPYNVSWHFYFTADLGPAESPFSSVNNHISKNQNWK